MGRGNRENGTRNPLEKTTGNFVNTKITGIFVLQVVNSLILKVKDIYMQYL